MKKYATLTAEESRRRKNRKRFLRKLTAYILLSLIGVSTVLPFLWMVSTSLKEPQAVFIQLKPWWRNWIPPKIVWSNYYRAWKAVPFGRFYLNSIIVAVCVTAGVVFTSSFAAYAFSRLNFPGRDKLFFAYIATMMIPGSVIIIPQFALIRILGWIDTYRALIIPAMFTAFGTFLLRQFFMTIPKDLEDAAKIDGCGYFGIYWRIILPLSKPALSTLTIFTFQGNWGSFMWPLLVTNRTELRTLPIGLEYFKSQYTTDWTLLMAGSVMVILPIILLFIFNQRFFVEGVKLTGIKG
ncbi:MAG: carbohydrate ABC transporter permease [Candidatus Omnitrophota bacterium]